MANSVHAHWNWEASLSPNRGRAEANSITERSQTVEVGLSSDTYAEANVDSLLGLFQSFLFRLTKCSRKSYTILDHSLIIAYRYQSLSSKPVRNPYICWRATFKPHESFFHDWVPQQAEERVLICDVVVLLPLRSLENLRILHHHYGTALKALSWHGAQDSGALRWLWRSSRSFS